MQETETPDPPRPLRLIAALQESEMQARLLELYADAVIDRMLPALCLTDDQIAECMQIDIDFAREADTYPQSDIGTDWQAGEEWQTDGAPASALPYAEMEMAHIRHHLFGFAFVGLFHLFERQLGTVLSWFTFRYKGIDWGPKGKPRKVEFHHLLTALECGQVPIGDSLKRDIDRLRLIANTVKHSDKALIELSKHHRDLLRGWYPELPLSPEHLTLTPKVFQGFVASLAGFWRAFPQE